MKKPPSQRPERQSDPGRTLVMSPLTVDLADEALIDLMRQYRETREREEKGGEEFIIVVFIGGYDDDPRELGEIPEVRAFCKRLVALGFIADLEPSTVIVPPQWMERTPRPRPFGAMEVWAVAEGLLCKSGRVDIEETRLKEFTDTILPRANRTADMMLSRPWPPQDASNN